MKIKQALLVVLVVAVYLLHQDFWFWRTARPLVFGFIPVGLFYHTCFTLATSLVMGMLVKQFWPSHLEQEPESAGVSRNQEDQVG